MSHSQPVIWILQKDCCEMPPAGQKQQTTDIGTMHVHGKWYNRKQEGSAIVY
jgi:hypothetical protein